MRKDVLILAALLMASAPTVHAQSQQQPCPIYEMREFIAYFMDDDVALSPDSQPVIKDFANFIITWATERESDPCWGKVERVIVTGHTDTLGDAETNMQLSKARAEAVADQLKALGINVPIVVRWRGETEQAFNTGDNVREILNSRVTMEWE
ncbi:MAG: OmpA family protein [Asticcacaulis sp.]|nr:OmpA family protein [Asticcacaulis sp.]